jgi:hypothetical protein
MAKFLYTTLSKPYVFVLVSKIQKLYNLIIGVNNGTEYF